MSPKVEESPKVVPEGMATTNYRPNTVIE